MVARCSGCFTLLAFLFHDVPVSRSYFVDIYVRLQAGGAFVFLQEKFRYLTHI